MKPTPTTRVKRRARRLGMTNSFQWTLDHTRNADFMQALPWPDYTAAASALGTSQGEEVICGPRVRALVRPPRTLSISPHDRDACVVGSPYYRRAIDHQGFGGVHGQG